MKGRKSKKKQSAEKAVLFWLSKRRRGLEGLEQQIGRCASMSKVPIPGFGTWKRKSGAEGTGFEDGDDACTMYKYKYSNTRDGSSEQYLVALVI